MPECKRCGSTQIVKSGMIREDKDKDKEAKQRYLCKRCGYHFVEGDQRETGTSAVLKALCVIFRALGIKHHREIGSYLKRDVSQIYKWMEKDQIDIWCSRQSSPYNSKKELINSLEKNLKDETMLAAEGTYDDLYIALIVQRRK